jgi:hypothetical protein
VNAVTRYAAVQSIAETAATAAITIPRRIITCEVFEQRGCHYTDFTDYYRLNDLAGFRAVKMPFTSSVTDV